MNAEGRGLYCIKIRRYGALGLEEEAGRVDLHVTDRIGVEQWLSTTIETLGPGDRAEITVTHGVQRPRGEVSAE